MSVNKETQSPSKGLDGLKWGIVVVLLALAIWGNYHYQNLVSADNTPVIPSYLRIIGVVVVIFVAVIVAILTSSGKTALNFAKEARIELRKVIWPTRQETLQTTLIIIVVTAVVSLVLWGLDSLMVKVVSIITSLGV